MARTNRCTICHHPQRSEIEREHISGATVRALAKKWGRNKSTIQAHFAKHATAAAQKAIEASEQRDIDAGAQMLAELEEAKRIARGIMARALKKDDLRTAMAGVRELMRKIELAARICGQIRDRDVNVAIFNVPAEALEGMARMFIARREMKRITPAEAQVSTGDQPVFAAEVIENE